MTSSINSDNNLSQAELYSKILAASSTSDDQSKDSLDPTDPSSIFYDPNLITGSPEALARAAQIKASINTESVGDPSALEVNNEVKKVGRRHRKGGGSGVNEIQQELLKQQLDAQEITKDQSSTKK